MLKSYPLKKKESEFIQSLQAIKSAVHDRDIRLQELIELFGENSHRMLIGFLCLPFLQPVPFPGLSTVFASLMAIISFYLLKKSPPWIPVKWRLKMIKGEKILMLIEKTEKHWQKIEKWIHPRWTGFQNLKWLRYLDFFIIIQCAFLLSLPLPIPLSNLIPVLPIFLNSLGHIEDDGALILASYLFYFITLAFFIFLALKAF